MKIFNLGYYDEEMLNKFIEFSNNNWEHEWCIYLESSGGSNWAQAQIQEILSKKLKTPSSCYLNVAKASSSAFRTIMEFEGTINVLNMARGMYHQSSMSLDISLNNKESCQSFGNFEETLKSGNKTELKDRIEFCKTFMSDKELQDYKDGKDIYYNEKQLLSLLNKRKNINV
jgi:hypothetical protein